MSKKHVEQSKLSDAQTAREHAARANWEKDKSIAALKTEITRLQAIVAEREAKEERMHVGAVAMIDALGFKGIYRHHSPKAIIERMLTIRREVKEYPSGAVDPSSVRIVNVSDMIVMGLHDIERNPALAISSVAFLVSNLLRFAALGDPPLAYRGCITYGEFEMEGDVLLGPAINEAAGSAEQAEAAVVWCTPSAARGLRGKENANDEHIFRGVVPLKEGLSYETYLVTAWSPVQTDREIADTIARILGTFEVGAVGREGLSVAVKQQHTERFLNAAKTSHQHNPKWTFQV